MFLLSYIITFEGFIGIISFHLINKEPDLTHSICEQVFKNTLKWIYTP